MILPSRGPTAQAPTHQPAQRWGPHHLRLHRHLLRHPELLPERATLLLALSGGQDSMALLALLHDLGRLHHWSLQLWHGDHRWRVDSGHQAAELERWTAGLGLSLHIDTWEPAAARSHPNRRTEASAREWRYGQLDARARAVGASHVVTAHTASDRAETLLLRLARGSHRRGLASLRHQRPLGSGAGDSAPILLTRPLLTFSRADTGHLCNELGLPIWTDPSNSDRRFSRNRIRAEVLPVLEELHPGAAQRISAQAERLVNEVEDRDALVDLALQALEAGDSCSDPGGSTRALRRPDLVREHPSTQGQLLHRWLERITGEALAARQLEELLPRLQAGQAPGTTVLRAGWQLCWNRHTLWLNPPQAQ